MTVGHDQYMSERNRSCPGVPTRTTEYLAKWPTVPQIMYNTLQKQTHHCIYWGWQTSKIMIYCTVGHAQYMSQVNPLCTVVLARVAKI